MPLTQRVMGSAGSVAKKQEQNLHWSKPLQDLLVNVRRSVDLRPNKLAQKPWSWFLAVDPWYLATGCNAKQCASSYPHGHTKGKESLLLSVRDPTKQATLCYPGWLHELAHRFSWSFTWQPQDQRFGLLHASAVGMSNSSTLALHGVCLWRRRVSCHDIRMWWHWESASLCEGAQRVMSFRFQVQGVVSCQPQSLSQLRKVFAVVQGTLVQMAVPLLFILRSPLKSRAAKSTCMWQSPP